MNSNHTPSRFTNALLVIDVQKSFTARPYWREEELEPYLKAQNALIEGFAARSAPIVRVFHVENEGPFSLASGLVKPLDGLAEFREQFVLQKSKHSAFAGTGLAQWLQEHGIRSLTVSGIRTEQCCETTTRDGSDRGFSVNYVSEATLTFPMTHAKGRVFSAAEIRERTELVLAGRFAKIMSVAQALEAI
jgi:nicotinamidase-related amidase